MFAPVNSSAELQSARRVAYLEALIEGYRAKNEELLADNSAAAAAAGGRALNGHRSSAGPTPHPRAKRDAVASVHAEESAVIRALEKQVDGLMKELRRRDEQVHQLRAQVHAQQPDPSEFLRIRRYYQGRVESAARLALQRHKKPGQRARSSSDLSDAEVLLAENQALRARVEEIDGIALSRDAGGSARNPAALPPPPEDLGRELDRLSGEYAEKVHRFETDLARYRALLSLHASADV